MLRLKSASLYLLGIIGLSLPISISLNLNPIQPAYACSPAPGSKPATIAQRVNKTPIVFQGVVRRVKGDTIVIYVKRYLKGAGPKLVNLKGFNQTSCDNFIQKPGGNFIFFAENRGKQPWNAVYDGAFGSVRSWDTKTREELRELGLIGKKVKKDSKCAFDSRKTVDTVENKVGKVRRIHDRLYIIVSEENRSRFAPCNFPDELKKDGLMIRFSGDVKEIYPNERWAATLFKLSDYKVLDAEDK
ncbi:hypothetical protein Riv7116_3665 [Rivularia sp. PCC 7116]|uniref:hypothetical protein n=1 Tax=Rivularia sp. PCC 7116 TaxID=373994 RepID=UPI00029F1AF7|nr:hypothetical protein [Rivularia sp. PCC 7116]AFY56114.1 hypothetical protein Riv7116_3665 [Rivularia sp. PCC 7116]